MTTAPEPHQAGAEIASSRGAGPRIDPVTSSPREPGFHGAVSEFKRRLIESTLTALGGNRTRAARALGLQRTYLLRLMREFAIDVPATPGHPRRDPSPPAAMSAPPAPRGR